MVAVTGRPLHVQATNYVPQYVDCLETLGKVTTAVLPVGGVFLGMFNLNGLASLYMKANWQDQRPILREMQQYQKCMMANFTVYGVTALAHSYFAGNVTTFCLGMWHIALGMLQWNDYSMDQETLIMRDSMEASLHLLNNRLHSVGENEVGSGTLNTQ